MTADIIPAHTEPFRSVLLFGPPGSGKGTIGKFLSSAGNHYHLSSGEIFRGLAPESPSGKLFHSYAGQGLLVPDETTIRICLHYVHGLIATNRYFPKQQLLLLDGIPRTLPQVEFMQEHIQVVRVIVLDVQNTDELVKRMKRRALIEKRLDDADERVLHTRFEVYRKDTAKLLECYPKQIISHFNAEQRPLEVLRDVLAELSHLLSHVH
jgi:adenylate kinase